MMKSNTLFQVLKQCPLKVQFFRRLILASRDRFIPPDYCVMRY